MVSTIRSTDLTKINKNDFLYVTHEEPHAFRRKRILEKYKEVKKLMKPELRTKYIVIASVCIQLYLAYICQNLDLLMFVSASYVVGATLNLSLFLAIHEMSHNFAFESPTCNKLSPSQSRCHIANILSR